jgi:D-xylose transport system permease protein
MSISVPRKPAEPSAPKDGRSWQTKVGEGIAGPYRSLPVILALAILWIVFNSANSAFLGSSNLHSLAQQVVPVGMLALGIVFVLLVGQIDLSSAALSAVAATICARLLVETGLPLVVAIAAAIAFAIAVTFVESLFVIYGVPSLIVTLGGMIMLQGGLLIALPPSFQVSLGGTSLAKFSGTDISTTACFIVVLIGAVLLVGLRLWGTLRAQRASGGQTTISRALVGALPALLGGAVLIVAVLIVGGSRGVPLSTAVFFGFLLVAWYMTTQTRYGTHLYAVGGNRAAAKRSGVPVARIVIYSFLVLGLCAGVAGLAESSRTLGVSTSTGGGSLMLDAIAAAVVGGTSLFGGRGSVWSAAIGALAIVSINSGVQLLGLAVEIQDLATGGVLILAVTIDLIVSRGSLRPSRGRLVRI